MNSLSATTYPLLTGISALDMMRFFSLLILLVLSVTPAMAAIQEPEKDNIRIFTFPENQPAEAEEFIFLHLLQLHQKGYLKAKADSIYNDQGKIIIHIRQGKQFYYFPLKITSKHNQPAADIIIQKPLPFAEFDAIVKLLLDNYSNSGFPFARVHRHQLFIQDTLIKLELELEAGEQFLFDSLRVEGNARLSRVFLEKFTGIRHGEPYNEKLIREASLKLQELEFIRMNDPLEVSFIPGKALVFIPANNNIANRFDGMAGIAGGGESELPVQITGLLDLRLSNLFGIGENIGISWQGPGHGTQILNLSAHYPYPLALPVETEADFSLHKQDSSWLQLRFSPSLFFDLAKSGKIGVFWKYTDNNQLNTFASGNSGIPIMMNYSTNLYGLEYRNHSKGYTRNLISRGYVITISGSAGLRLLNNSDLNEMNAGILKHKTSMINSESLLEKRWQSGQRSTISAGVRSGWISGDHHPQNQLYQIGGFRSLKGFDELSMSASSFAIGSAQYRFFTGPASYLHLFVNGGWYEQKSSGIYYNDFPIGLGTGINLQTQAGIFSVDLALGWRKSIPVHSRNTKIHIGYISLF
jgi:outer membrane protein assembly factor BamA